MSASLKWYRFINELIIKKSFQFLINKYRLLICDELRAVPENVRLSDKGRPATKTSLDQMWSVFPRTASKPVWLITESEGDRRVLAGMEPAGDRTEDVNKGEDPAEDKAADQTSVTSTSVSPRMGLRERGAARPRSGVSASLTGVNGAAASPQSSGRVLRDRATRSVPAWLKDVKSDDEEEPSPETGASKRRKSFQLQAEEKFGICVFGRRGSRRWQPSRHRVGF